MNNKIDLPQLINNNIGKFFFLYGKPEVGKQTLVKKILTLYDINLRVFLFTKDGNDYKDIIPQTNIIVKPISSHFSSLISSLNKDEKTILIFDDYDHSNMKKNNLYMSEIIDTYAKKNLDIFICSSTAQLNNYFIDALDYLIIFGTKNNSEVQRLYDKYIDSLYLTFSKFKFIVSTLKNDDFLIYTYDDTNFIKHIVHPSVTLGEYSILGKEYELKTEVEPKKRSLNIININLSDTIMNSIINDKIEITLSIKPKGYGV